MNEQINKVPAQKCSLQRVNLFLKEFIFTIWVEAIKQIPFSV